MPWLVPGFGPLDARESMTAFGPESPKEQPPPESLRQQDRARLDSLESVRALARAAEGVTAGLGPSGKALRSQ